MASQNSTQWLNRERLGPVLERLEQQESWTNPEAAEDRAWDRALERLKPIWAEQDAQAARNRKAAGLEPEEPEAPAQGELPLPE